MLITNLLIIFFANKYFWRYDVFRVVLFSLFVPFSRMNIFVISLVYTALRMFIWISITSFSRRIFEHAHHSFCFIYCACAIFLRPFFWTIIWFSSLISIVLYSRVSIAFYCAYPVLFADSVVKLLFYLPVIFIFLILYGYLWWLQLELLWSDSEFF